MIDYDTMKIENEVGTFWVVTKANSKDTEKCDILFETTVLDMGLQFLGGLKPEEILLITQNEQKADDYANALIGMNQQGMYL